MEEEAEIFFSLGYSPSPYKATAEAAHAPDTELLTATLHTLIILASYHTY